MGKNQIHLFGSRRFMPLFITQALGALNDNIFKNALVLLVVYRISEQAGINGQILVTIAAGVFILPFFLFSATAGQIADKYEKSKIIRWIKAFEIGIMVLGSYALWLNDPYYLIGVLFLMGSQSAFFGPVKYSILPTHLGEDELISGNALIEAGTFLAILLGTIAGSLLILKENGETIVSLTVIAIAALGLVASFFIPKAVAPAPDLKINLNIVSETWNIIRKSAERRDIFLSILGISWFWLVGATFLSQFPAFAKDLVFGDETVVTLFLATFSIGIGIGSLVCNKLLNGEVSAKYVPLGALGISLFIFDLYLAT